MMDLMTDLQEVIAMLDPIDTRAKLSDKLNPITGDRALERIIEEIRELHTTYAGPDRDELVLLLQQTCLVFKKSMMDPRTTADRYFKGRIYGDTTGLSKERKRIQQAREDLEHLRAEIDRKYHDLFEATP